jgi:hypothetical protein
MERGWLNLPYVVWAAICLAFALAWAVAWPRERAVEALGLRLFLIRWGHSITWGLLAAMCAMKAGSRPNLAGWGNVVGLLAVPAYLAFLTATFIVR